MKLFKSSTWLLLLLITIIVTTAYFFWYKPALAVPGNIYPSKAPDGSRNKANMALRYPLKQKAASIRSYVTANDFNSNVCFMIDMNIHSGKPRFFIYNLQSDSIEMEGLVTHGSGLIGDGDRIEFSNVSGSNCTSLGRYKIGNPYNGKFGLAYKLYGLDKTNNNAFERFVVLHAHECVPVSEVYPLFICESWGCPTVSPAFLQKLKKYIDGSKKPILLNIYR